jgi:hypothetical protein
LIELQRLPVKKIQKRKRKFLHRDFKKDIGPWGGVDQPKFTAYLGPRDVEILRKYEKEAPEVEQIVAHSPFGNNI